MLSIRHFNRFADRYDFSIHGGANARGKRFRKKKGKKKNRNCDALRSYRNSKTHHKLNEQLL